MLTAADARTNTSSANYQSGYSAGKNDVTLSVSGATVNASNGKSATVAYKGTYYSSSTNVGTYYSSSTNVGTTGDYFHATFPEGYYATEGNGWAPEIRVPITTMNSSGWYTSDQYNSNYQSGYNAGYTNGHSAKKSTTLTISLSMWSSHDDSGTKWHADVSVNGSHVCGAQQGGATGYYTVRL